MTLLTGTAVVLRLADERDIAELVRIRSTPEVRHWWRGDDLLCELREDVSDPDKRFFAIEYEGQVVGAIQCDEETEPDYRHATIDVYLDPAVHGRGLGSDAVRTLARHLTVDCGHHRVVIDPAADNAAAIRTYEKVGFRPVGVMRRYERGEDGTWHDGLLMDLLADELS